MERLHRRTWIPLPHLGATAVIGAKMMKRPLAIFFQIHVTALLLVALPASAQWAHLDDANALKTPPPSSFPSIQQHAFPRTLVHEMQGPVSNAEYGKYDFIDAHGSSFERMANVQNAYSSNIMLLRHISARAYQNFNANFCRISSGLAFESSPQVSQGGPESSGCGIYAGHWLYSAGTKTNHSITAQAMTVKVADPSRLVAGQYVVIYDAPAGSFNNAEHARVISSNNATGTVTFNKRGFKSMARARAAGAIIATHVLGQGPEDELWAFNFSTQSPRDGNGETFSSFFSKWLKRNWDRYSDGERTTANLAGLLFDADMYFEINSAKADYNNDLVVDHGISGSGVNWQGAGLDQFYATTRSLLPNIHIVSGLHDARGYDSNNGIQLENWLDFGNGDFNPNPKYGQLNSMFATYLYNMGERGANPIAHNLTKTPTKEYRSGTQASSNAPFRLGLALTLMDAGYFGTHANVVGDAWWDEYAVDVTRGSQNFGKAIDKSNLTAIQANKGWLGQPLGKFTRVYKQADFAAAQSVLANGSFEGGINSWSSSNATVSSSNNAVEGSKALHVSEMSTFKGTPAGATVRSEQIRLTAGKEYTVSFMARASKSRELRVTLGSLNEKIPVGSNWRRYVLSFRQNGNQNNALTLQVGRESTAVWLDSMFVFEGSANVFRRDFEHGIVLANASSLPKTVELNGTFRKISGRQDPAINNGNSVTKVTLGAYDGVLLVRPDGSAPPRTPTPPPPSNSGQIGDLVWQDDNENGVQDVGEDGVAGAMVDLYDCSNNILRSTDTNASGRYSFTQLASGNYVVRFAAPDGMSLSPALQGNSTSTDSNPNPATGFTDCVALTNAQARNGVDAGMVVDEVVNPPPVGAASFGDLVWVDSNGNGIQNSGEPGLPGAKVNLRSCSGDLVKSTLTDSNGRYKFAELNAGHYKLEFPAPTGMHLTLSKQGDNSGRDSNPSQATGLTNCLSVTNSQFRGGIDVGLTAVAPSTPRPSTPSSDTPGTSGDADSAPKEFGSGGGSASLWFLGLLGLLTRRRRA